VADANQSPVPAQEQRSVALAKVDRSAIANSRSRRFLVEAMPRGNDARTLRVIFDQKAATPDVAILNTQERRDGCTPKAEQESSSKKHESGLVLGRGAIRDTRRVSQLIRLGRRYAFNQAVET
jgi:hypothetical protein